MVIINYDNGNFFQKRQKEKEKVLMNKFIIKTINNHYGIKTNGCIQLNISSSILYIIISNRF